jgi:hypothetical protein
MNKFRPLVERVGHCFPKFGRKEYLPLFLLKPVMKRLQYRQASFFPPALKRRRIYLMFRKFFSQFPLYRL